MRSLLVLLAIGSLGLGLAACGSSGKAASNSTASSPIASVSTTTPTTTEPNPEPAPAPTKSDPDSDKDNDIGANGKDVSTNGPLDYILDVGTEAGAADKQAITKLVKRYYAAALADDGAKACTMVYSTLAEAIPEDFGKSPPGPSYAHGRTCAEVLTHLFGHLHAQLAAEVPKLKVIRVRLEEHHGLAELRFGNSPPHRISIAREGHVWKLQTVIDSTLP